MTRGRGIGGKPKIFCFKYGGAGQEGMGMSREG